MYVDQGKKGIFSWLITVLFWIIHVDLWSLGLIEDNYGKKGYLINSMYDVTQFIASSSTTDINVAHLAHLFIADVILTFGICLVVVIGDGSSFKRVFKSMCNVLSMVY